MAQTDPFFSTLDCARFEGVTFDGFPYLIVHPSLGINHIILLPRGLNDETLRWIAYQQFNANRFLSLSFWRPTARSSICPRAGWPGPFRSCSQAFPSPAVPTRVEDHSPEYLATLAIPCSSPICGFVLKPHGKVSRNSH